MICGGMFVPCMKTYCCDRCNKKLNGQKLGRRYRWDFRAERELWEEGGVNNQMWRKQHEQYGEMR